MRHFAVVAALAISASAQTLPSLLSEGQIRELEKKVAQNPGDLRSQPLLGQNYAFFILGITSFGRYGMVDGVDPARALGSFAQHGRDQLAKSPLAGVVGEAGQTLWRYSTDVRSYEILNTWASRFRFKTRKRWAYRVSTGRSRWSPTTGYGASIGSLFLFTDPSSIPACRSVPPTPTPR